MSSVPTETQTDLVFLYVGFILSDPTRVKFLETMIKRLKNEYYAHRVFPGDTLDETQMEYGRKIFVDASRDIYEQINEFLPELLESLEKDLDLAKEEHARSMEG